MTTGATENLYIIIIAANLDGHAMFSKRPHFDELMDAVDG